MKVKQLIKKLNLADPESEVMLGFDSGIRMNAEIVARTINEEEDIPKNSIVLTGKYEYSFVKKWHDMRIL